MKGSTRSKSAGLRRYTFDAGNSKTGVAGIVMAVCAHSKREATLLANHYLETVANPIDLEVEQAWKNRGILYAMYCIGANLKKRDIDADAIVEVECDGRNRS
jgi:hypothetical protein